MNRFNLWTHAGKKFRFKLKVPMNPSNYSWEKRTLYLHTFCITILFRYHEQEIHKTYNYCVVLIMFIPHLLIFFKEEMVNLNTYNMTCINKIKSLLNLSVLLRVGDIKLKDQTRLTPVE